MSLTRPNALTTRYSWQTTSVRASGRQLIGWIFAGTAASPLTRTSSSSVWTLSSSPALKSPMTLCAHAGSTSMPFATSRHRPTSPMCAPGLDSSIRRHTPLLPLSACCPFANYWNLAHPSSRITWTTSLKNLNHWSSMRLKRASAYLTNPNHTCSWIPLLPNWGGGRCRCPLQSQILCPWLQWPDCCCGSQAPAQGARWLIPRGHSKR